MADTQSSNNAGYIALGAIGVVVIFIVILGHPTASSTSKVQPFGSSELGDQLNQIDPVATVEPLSASAIKTGQRHYGMASKVEGLPGAMIYSQNCYDSISHRFSWERLDICGAFDLRAENEAARATDTDEGQSEADYFAPEMGEQRYLAALTHAGMATDDADLRLEALQKAIQ